MRNAGLEEAQAGIKTAWRNINNLRYADDTTLMAESEEELKILLIKVENNIFWQNHGWKSYQLLEDIFNWQGDSGKRGFTSERQKCLIACDFWIP